jgi:hypothetical protein
MIDRTTPIPYWVEREASNFRKSQRGEIAADEQIDEAKRVLRHETNQQLPRKHRKPE